MHVSTSQATENVIYPGEQGPRGANWPVNQSRGAATASVTCLGLLFSPSPLLSLSLSNAGLSAIPCPACRCRPPTVPRRPSGSPRPGRPYPSISGAACGVHRLRSLHVELQCYTAPRLRKTATSAPPSFPRTPHSRTSCRVARGT